MFTKFKNEDLSVDFCPHFFFKVNLRVVKPNSNKKSSQKANKELIKKLYLNLQKPSSYANKLIW